MLSIVWCIYSFSLSVQNPRTRWMTCSVEWNSSINCWRNFSQSVWRYVNLFQSIWSYPWFDLLQLQSECPRLDNLIYAVAEELTINQTADKDQMRHVLEGILAHFFSVHRSLYHDEDIKLFLKLANRQTRWLATYGMDEVIDVSYGQSLCSWKLKGAICRLNSLMTYWIWLQVWVQCWKVLCRSLVATFHSRFINSISTKFYWMIWSNAVILLLVLCFFSTKPRYVC